LETPLLVKLLHIFEVLVDLLLAPAAPLLHLLALRLGPDILLLKDPEGSMLWSMLLPFFAQFRRVKN
jgi:hypothetical protein